MLKNAILTKNLIKIDNTIVQLKKKLKNFKQSYELSMY